LGEGIGGDYPVVYSLCDYDDGLGAGKALYAGGYFSSAGGYESFCIARWGCETAVTSIPQAKQSFDNRLVNLTGVVSTLATGQVFYVSEVIGEAQVSGIRVELSDNNIDPGHLVSVTGRVKTNTIGERYIRAWSAQSGEPAIAKPVYMTAKNLGGGPFGFAGAAGQTGVVDGVGLNNIGLLVRVCGRFTQIDDQTFLLDDGGAQVRCIATPGVIVGPTWHYVAVTGVCSCVRDGQAVYPQLIVNAAQGVEFPD
jgi:uncharacterized protein YdeI (BOF family)